METIRCACYTRKSSDDATLDRDFNSLTSQREACENYINSQREKGWICLDYTFRTGDIKEETVSYTTGTYKLTDVLNYRESPDVYSQTYGLVHTGTVLDITEVSGVWGKTVYNGKECWVCLEYADRIGDITVTAIKTN